VGLHGRQSCTPVISSKVFHKSLDVQYMLVGNLCKFILQTILTNNAKSEFELRLSEIKGVRLSDIVGGMLMSSLPSLVGISERLDLQLKEKTERKTEFRAQQLFLKRFACGHSYRNAYVNMHGATISEEPCVWTRL